MSGGDIGVVPLEHRGQMAVDGPWWEQLVLDVESDGDWFVFSLGGGSPELLSESRLTHRFW